MGYPIKTSNDNWLSLAQELFARRVSFDIHDDAGYDLNKNNNIRKTFKRLTLETNSLITISAFYIIAALCFCLLILSFFLEHAKYIAIIFSTLTTIACVIIPSYFLKKNWVPRVSNTKDGLKVSFRRDVNNKDQLVN